MATQPKIFKVCDILNKDDKPIAFFSDLKPGEVVLARWNDNKFYSATVDYIGTSDAKKPVRCTKDIKKKDIAAQRFYSLPSNQAAQSFSTHQSQDVECSVQPPPTQSTPSTNPQSPTHSHLQLTSSTTSNGTRQIPRPTTAFLKCYTRP